MNDETAEQRYQTPKPVNPVIRMNRSENINELAKAMVEVQKAELSAVLNSSNPFFSSKYADLARSGGWLGLSCLPMVLLCSRFRATRTATCRCLPCWFIRRDNGYREQSHCAPPSRTRKALVPVSPTLGATG